MRALVLTAQIGESHTAMAHALAARLRTRPDVAQAIVLDRFAMLGQPLGSLLGRGYRFHLGRVGWSYNLAYALFTGVEPARRLGEGALYALGGRGLQATIARHAPDVVVSTHPVLTSVLGHLRAAGRLRCCAAAVVGPLGGLAFWAHPGLDLHLLMYPEALGDVEQIAGPGRAQSVRPLVREEFLEPPKTPGQAREELGIALDGPLVVVSGGGWGAGDITGAVDACLALPEIRVIVVAGRNEGLREELEHRYGGEGRVAVLGFSERIRDMMCAADAFVTATAGLSSVEARLCGCRLICYGFPVGHVRDNTRALAAHGLARVATTPEELETELGAALLAGRPPPSPLRQLPDAAATIAELVRGAGRDITPIARVSAVRAPASRRRLECPPSG